MSRPATPETFEYLGIPYYSPGLPLQLHFVEHIEVALQATLPPEYKEFLRHANGCFVGLPGVEVDGKWKRYPGSWGMTPPRAAKLKTKSLHGYYLYSTTPYSGGLCLSANAWPGLFPIGQASYDHVYFCISLRDEDYGQVHLTIWKVNRRTNDPGIDKLIPLANNFTDWWTSIVPIEPDLD